MRDGIPLLPVESYRDVANLIGGPTSIHVAYKAPHYGQLEDHLRTGLGPVKITGNPSVEPVSIVLNGDPTISTDQLVDIYSKSLVTSRPGSHGAVTLLRDGSVLSAEEGYQKKIYRKDDAIAHMKFKFATWELKEEGNLKVTGNHTHFFLQYGRGTKIHIPLENMLIDNNYSYKVQKN